MRTFIACTLHKILLGRSNQGEWIVGACSTHGSDEKCRQYFSWET